MIDAREYEQLARETGVFKDIELDILKESLLVWQKRPGDPYTLLDLRDGRTLAGFALMARAQNTEYSYDIRALCIERAYIGKGVSQRLLEMLEEELLGRESSALIRCELSRRKEDALGRGLFIQAGYSLLGHIADFYEAGDDYFMYAKHIDSRARKAAGAGQDADAEPAESPARAAEGEAETGPEA
ncbi:MAG TPA: GNAT family N-acetyltransferase [Spirochaetales bacterium]|nr:GNAT family N-acetyltransferase [Spirochaetales bacterium]HRY55705.1 GNAT family N-acetyltransferase [Spirochaetia bacterium]